MAEGYKTKETDYGGDSHGRFTKEFAEGLQAAIDRCDRGLGNTYSTARAAMRAILGPPRPRRFRT